MKAKTAFVFPFLLFLVLTFFGCNYDPLKDQSTKTNEKVNLSLNEEQALLLASLPMKCLEQEYPNKLNQVLSDSSQLLRPKTLHPAFYGCFDWHSAVHGQWLLVRLLKDFPEIPMPDIRIKLAGLLTSENIEQELAYFKRSENLSFERTYGWAWLLKLHEETLDWEDSLGKVFSINLEPLADHIVTSYISFLPKLMYPIRNGEHTNTAFGLSLAYDYAKATNNQELKALIEERAIVYYGKDANAPMQMEPSGFDFLSPLLEEARLMQKVMVHREFLPWLNNFLPQLFKKDFVLQPAEVSDRNDGKLVHLDGVNLSRASCLYELSRADKKLKHLRKIADQHLQATLPRIVDGGYMGEHWLASFALNALLQRNLR